MDDKEQIYPIPEQLFSTSHINEHKYLEDYQESITDPDKFWAEKAKEFISFSKTWDKVSDCDYLTGKVEWFSGAKLNVSYNCIDRHLISENGKNKSEQVAIIWEGNEPGDSKKFTYKQLHEEVQIFANTLIKFGVKKGDRVAIYLPMIPELAFAMLACARIGAIHSIIFGGFSAESIRDRINDSTCKVLITSNVALRGNKKINLKEIADQALLNCPSIENVIVCHRTDEPYSIIKNRDHSYEDLRNTVSKVCPPVDLDAEDPLFILYTSGSTGKPKGVLHTQAGYLLYAAMTHKYVFDYHPEEVYFCAADIGWITGHSYIIYGPLANGATTLMFESIPTYPDAGRYWDIVERHKVNIFYTAPTAIRAIAKAGEGFVTKYDRSSLRILGSVGEPINRDAWLWYYNTVGEGRCAVVDTWWQTETGGILISPLPGAIKTKPGSATKPFFGIEPCLVNDQGQELTETVATGKLCIKRSWPGQMRTVYGDHERFLKTYLTEFPGKYFSGDAAHRDADGYYWINGRVDDVLNVSGHRLGTAEIESAIVSSNIVAEAAVVGFPHEIKGTGIFAFCILKSELDENVAKELIFNSVKRAIGAFACPDQILAVPGLPKTRSGKIMRRILRKIAEGEREEFGDISTLAEPDIVNDIISLSSRKNP